MGISLSTRYSEYPKIRWADALERSIAVDGFWKGLPLSMLPRARSASEAIDFACAEALAAAPGFLPAFAKAIEALGLPPTSLFATNPMASLSIRAIKTQPEWLAKRAAAELGAGVMAAQVRSDELALFAKHGFDLGESMGRREKIQALDSWLACGAGPSSSQTDFAARLEASRQSLRWLEESGWICPEDYPEQLGRIDRRAKGCVGREGHRRKSPH